MNSIRRLFTVLFGTVLMFTSCGVPDLVPENEEESIYLLVGEPCSEGDYPKAIARADSLLAAPREMSDSLKAFIMIDRNVSILEYGALDWSLANTDTLIQFGRKSGIDIAVMQGLQNRGICLKRKGDNTAAIAAYKEGLEIAVASGDGDMEQVFSEMLAIACAESGLYEEAASFATRSIEMSREAGDEMGELNSISTLGGILVKDGKYNEAIDALAPYHDGVRRTKSLLRVKYLTPLLRSYLSLDSLAKAKEILSEAYEALEGMPRNTQAYLVVVNAEAVIAEKEGRFADQWCWLQTADTIGGMGTSPDIRAIERARCLANLGRWQEAYVMECRAYEAIDSIRKTGDYQALSELMVKYDTLAKENDIERLKSARLLWALIALGALTVVIVGVILVISARRRARFRLERERQKEYLRGMEQERGRIARELHDDIAGSLVGIQLQMRASASDRVRDALLEVVKRVRRMSHEMMPPEFRQLSFTSMVLDYVTRANTSGGRHRIVLTDEGCYPWNALSASESHELYRIVQEAVANARKHGAEGGIEIVLGGDIDGYYLRIVNPLVNKENSKDELIEDGIGLQSLRMRTALLGASLAVKKEDGLFIVEVSKNVSDR